MDFLGKMSDCPIGLICEYFECDRRHCFNLVKPWPLPYWNFVPHSDLQPTYGFTVEIPSYAEDDFEDEHVVESNSRYNEWVGSIRQELWLAGWWEAVKLPYKSHPDGGLLVFRSLPCEESVTFACPWDFTYGFRKYVPYWDRFEPPVPIDGYQQIFGTAIVPSEENYTEGQCTMEGYSILYYWDFPEYEDELLDL